MLMLNMVNQYGEFRKCDISGELIGYGEYYYQDTVDGTTIKATVYKKLQQERKEQEFDYTLLNIAQSEQEYKENLKKAKQEFLKNTILDRPIAEKGEVKNDNTKDE